MSRFFSPQLSKLVVRDFRPMGRRRDYILAGPVTTILRSLRADRISKGDKQMSMDRAPAGLSRFQQLQFLVFLRQQQRSLRKIYRTYLALKAGVI